MFVRYRTQALVLKKKALGEADQLFTVFTKNFGKLKILGRAIRKIKSKLRGNSQLFSLLEIEFIQGKSYKTLTDVLLIKNFPQIKKDLRKLKIAYKITELSDNLIKGQEPDEKIWQLLIETFKKLNNQQLSSAIAKRSERRGRSRLRTSAINNYQLIYYYFLWNLLAILGYRPQLHNCILCQKKLKPEKLYFGLKEGGVICFNCSKKTKASPTSISPDTVKILRLILNQDWLILKKLKVEEKNFRSLKNLSQKFLNYILAQIK